MSELIFFGKSEFYGMYNELPKNQGLFVGKSYIIEETSYFGTIAIRNLNGNLLGYVPEKHLIKLFCSKKDFRKYKLNIINTKNKEYEYSKTRI